MLRKKKRTRHRTGMGGGQKQAVLFCRMIGRSGKSQREYCSALGAVFKKDVGKI